MSTPSGKRFNPRALALCAGCGYLVALAVTLTTGHFLALERNARAMDRFGTQLADDLAFLAVEPMMRPDRIRLGLLANRMAERTEVRSVEMYSIDGLPLVVAGNPPSNGNAYISPVAIQSTAAGHVRVALHADRFRPLANALLAQSWRFLAAGFVVSVGGAYGIARFVVRNRRPALALAEDDDQADSSPEQVFLLVATRFPRGGHDAHVSTDVRHRSEDIAGRVANLYAGEAVRWQDKGVALVFQANDSEDRAFEAVCAALLIQRLLAAPDSVKEPDDGTVPGDTGGLSEAQPIPYRFGLDLVTPDWLVDQTAPADATPAKAVAVLASLAPNGALAIGRAAYAAIGNTEQIQLQGFTNPVFQALSDDAVPLGIVTGTDPGHDALIARQAGWIAAAPPT